MARSRVKTLNTIQEIKDRVFNDKSSPSRLAFAVALGVFLGCSPLYGLHVIIGIALAHLWRLNTIALVLGTQISMPLFAPFVAYGCVQVGALLLRGHWVSLRLTDLTWSALPSIALEFAWSWAVGGAIIGAILGGISYLITLSIARRRQKNKLT